MKKRKLEDKEIISREIGRHEFVSVLHHLTALFAVRWCQLQRIQSALPPLNFTFGV
jgi:hypothetical protein